MLNPEFNPNGASACYASLDQRDVKQGKMTAATVVVLSAEFSRDRAQL